MMRRRLFALLVTLIASPATATENFPLDQVRPGMVGVGRTVFEGTKIEDFKVTILGVLENIGPKQTMIVARLEGGPLEKTGVIAGMSGSPVFIDGKLLGAVAYGFPFSKETIAGITPIGEMLTATSTDTPRAAAARFPATFGPGGPAQPLDRESIVAALRRPPRLFNADPSGLRGGPFPNSLAGLTLAPIPLPMVFSGFDPAVFEWARGVFAGFGFSPVMGTGRAGIPEGPLPDLQPGAAVGVSLLEGDFDLSVTGTITAIENDRVYAFGHPFYNLGPTQFPMKKAYVYSVFPSLYQSWKISTALDEPVGTIEQDRMTAISGRLGKAPHMIPVSVTLTTSRGQEREYAFRMVEDELFSPVLTYIALLSVLQANERAFGTSTMQVDAKLSLVGKPDVRVEDLFAENQPAAQASALVAAPIAYLMSNDFEHVSVDKVDVRVSSQETVQSASLKRAWVERVGPVHPGSTVPLKVLLRTYRGEARTETIPVAIPANAREGHYALFVADAATMTNMEQREMRQSFLPKDLNQLIRAINGLRHNNHIYVRLLRADDGAIVSGEYLPSLPPSVLSVLGPADSGGTVIPIRTASVWDFDLPIDYAVTGSRMLSLTVER